MREWRNLSKDCRRLKAGPAYIEDGAIAAAFEVVLMGNLKGVGSRGKRRAMDVCSRAYLRSEVEDVRPSFSYSVEDYLLLLFIYWSQFDALN